MGFSGMADRMV